MKTRYAGTCHVKQVHPAKNPSGKGIGLTMGSRAATRELGKLLIAAADDPDPAFDNGAILHAKYKENKDGTKSVTIVSARKS